MKAYLFRHQHKGIDPTRVFLQPPTDAQMASMNAHADSVHGAGWGMIVETDIVSDDTVPEFDIEQSGSGTPGELSLGVPMMTFGAIGTVTNPE